MPRSDDGMGGPWLLLTLLVLLTIGPALFYFVLLLGCELAGGFRCRR